jgi:hypothetical protein
MDKVIAARRAFQWINQELEKLRESGANPGVIANLITVNEEMNDSIINLLNTHQWYHLNNSLTSATGSQPQISEPTASVYIS